MLGGTIDGAGYVDDGPRHGAHVRHIRDGDFRDRDDANRPRIRPGKEHEEQKAPPPPSSAPSFAIVTSGLKISFATNVTATLIAAPLDTATMLHGRTVPAAGRRASAGGEKRENADLRVAALEIANEVRQAKEQLLFLQTIGDEALPPEVYVLDEEIDLLSLSAEERSAKIQELNAEIANLELQRDEIAATSQKMAGFVRDRVNSMENPRTAHVKRCELFKKLFAIISEGKNYAVKPGWWAAAMKEVIKELNARPDSQYGRRVAGRKRLAQEKQFCLEIRARRAKARYQYEMTGDEEDVPNLHLERQEHNGAGRSKLSKYEFSPEDNYMYREGKSAKAKKLPMQEKNEAQQAEAQNRSEVSRGISYVRKLLATAGYLKKKGYTSSFSSWLDQDKSIQHAQEFLDERRKEKKKLAEGTVPEIIPLQAVLKLVDDLRGYVTKLLPFAEIDESANVNDAAQDSADASTNAPNEGIFVAHRKNKQRDKNATVRRKRERIEKEEFPHLLAHYESASVALENYESACEEDEMQAHEDAYQASLAAEDDEDSPNDGEINRNGLAPEQVSTFAPRDASLAATDAMG